MPVQNRDIAVRFFPIFIPIAVLTIIVIYAFFTVNQRSARNFIERDELINIAHLKAVSSSDLRSVIADLLILSDHNKHLNVLGADNGVIMGWLRHEYISFSSRKGVYDQIRLLDKDGMEVIRVDYKDGEAISTPPSELQNKGSRYYFKDTIKLGLGDIFVSQLDLNVENGEVQVPRKPVMRIGTPVFDGNRRKVGIVLLNYLGAEFLGNIKRNHIGSLSELLVLNREGYYLIAHRTDDEWGFMYEDKADRRFQNAYPGVWKKILQEKDGQIYSGDGLFTFATIYPVLDAMGWKGAGGVKNRRYFLRIVSVVSASVIGEQMNAMSYVRAAVMVLIVFAVLTWFLARARARRSRAEGKLDYCEREH
jgi:hypothetical protein